MDKTHNCKHLWKIYLIPWASLFVGCLIGASAGNNSEAVGAWLLLASALFFGLPHGGYDFRLLLDATRRNGKNEPALYALLAAYFFCALAFIGLWYFAPELALIIFLLLTAWHFGSGDVIWQNQNRKNLIFDAVGRGLIVVFAPLVFYPQESGFVLSKLNAESSAYFILQAPYFLFGGLVFFFIGIFSALLRRSGKRLEELPLMWLETLLLLVFFALTTPLQAVAIYFVGVHSWRHFLRLNLYKNGGIVSEEATGKETFAYFHRRALPLTLISLTGLFLIFHLLNLKFIELTNQVSAYLILLSALTVPHALLISWMEISIGKTSRMAEI